MDHANSTLMKSFLGGGVQCNKQGKVINRWWARILRT